MIVPDSRRKWVAVVLPTALMLALALPAFRRYKAAFSNRSSETQPGPAATPAEPPRAPAEAAAAPAPRVNAARAMQYVREVVAFGPRPIGSSAHRKLESYIVDHLKGVAVEHDDFTASTPKGEFPVHNIIAKFPGSKPGVVVIATHYDTLMSRPDFVGANDGGSGTGLLLEIANQLRSSKRDGYSVWLVWLDAEEAVLHWTDTDSLYGSRHLAARWREDGTTGKIKAFLLADMVGDADLGIERDGNSTPWLEDLVYQAAKDLGYQSHFFERGGDINDDHVPFAKAGVPVADLIDFSYGYNNVFWHTAQDTLDKLSPKSLEIVGNVMLETIALLDSK